MKIFVISMDTEVGAERRSKLNFDYEWFKANDIVLDFIKEKMIHFWNSGEKHKKGKNGVSDSYYRLFKKIYEEKIDDFIILEDDCFIENKEFLEFCKNKPKEICYLNGLFINKKGWKKYNNFSLNKGINKIDYEKSRILCLWGLYIPSYTDVLPIIDMFENSKRLRCVDIMIMNKEIVKHYYYPACSYVNDGGFSQIGNKKCGIHKNYK
jgi:GR25 family glycosyltransferase involved in LPS biosynthesis